MLTDSKEKKVEEVFGFNLQIYILLENCDKNLSGKIDVKFTLWFLMGLIGLNSSHMLRAPQGTL